MNRFNCVLVVVFLTLALASARADDISEAIEQGHTAFARGQYEMAIQQYSRALSGYGEHVAFVHYNIGVCHYRLGHKLEAVRHYRQAIQFHSGKYANASYALGLVLTELNQIAEAKSSFIEAIKASDGKHARALFELGLIALSEGDDQTAATLFQCAIANDKNFPAAHNNLGVLQARAGNIAVAEREFTIAIRQSNGKFEEAAHNLKLCQRRIDTDSRTFLASLKTTELHTRQP